MHAYIKRSTECTININTIFIEEDAPMAISGNIVLSIDNDTTKINAIIAPIEKILFQLYGIG